MQLYTTSAISLHSLDIMHHIFHIKTSALLTFCV